MKNYKLITLALISLIPLLLNAQTGKWQAVKTKNKGANRNECGLAAIHDKLYIIGGDAGEALTVLCFDTKTLEFTELAKAPVLMHHFQAVALQKKIYVLEAFSSGGFPNQEPMSGVYVYNTEDNTWQQGGELPAERRRAGAAAVTYNGKLYLIDGIQHGHASGTNNMFDMYDPETKTWKALPDAPHIRDHCSAAVINDKLYVVGGRNTSYRDPNNKITFFSQTVLDVDCYNFSTGKWSTLNAKLPLGSGGGAVVSLNNVLYYMGGERATDTEPNAARKNVYRLNPVTDKVWTEIDSLNYARNGMAATVCNNEIYVAGGSGGGMPPPGKIGMPPPGFNPGNMNHNDSMHQEPPPPQMPPPGGMGNHHNDSIKIEVYTS